MKFLIGMLISVGVVLKTLIVFFFSPSTFISDLYKTAYAIW